MDREHKIELKRAMIDVRFKLRVSGYDVFAIILQGSQNYGLEIYSDTYKSDYDFKAFIYPSLTDLYRGTKISTTIPTEYGLVEVKDIRLLPELLGKMNPSYLELLASKFYFADEQWEDIRCHLDELIEERKPLFYKSSMGMSYEKQKALRHPYPSIVDKIEKYGYDPKQAHHIRRLLSLVRGVDDGKSYAVAMTPNENESDYLKQIKLGTIPNEHIDGYVNLWLAELKEITSVDMAGISSEALHSIELAVERIVLDRIKELNK